jgi:hypothetical protein
VQQGSIIIQKNNYEEVYGPTIVEGSSRIELVPATKVFSARNSGLLSIYKHKGNEAGIWTTHHSNFLFDCMTGTKSSHMN